MFFPFVAKRHQYANGINFTACLYALVRLISKKCDALFTVAGDTMLRLCKCAVMTLCLFVHVLECSPVSFVWNEFHNISLSLHVAYATNFTIIVHKLRLLNDHCRSIPCRRHQNVCDSRKNLVYFSRSTCLFLPFNISSRLPAVSIYSVQYWIYGAQLHAMIMHNKFGTQITSIIVSNLFSLGYSKHN